MPKEELPQYLKEFQWNNVFISEEETDLLRQLYGLGMTQKMFRSLVKGKDDSEIISGLLSELKRRLELWKESIEDLQRKDEGVDAVKMREQIPGLITAPGRIKQALEDYEEVIRQERGNRFKPEAFAHLRGLLNNLFEKASIAFENLSLITHKIPYNDLKKLISDYEGSHLNYEGLYLKSLAKVRESVQHLLEKEISVFSPFKDRGPEQFIKKLETTTLPQHIAITTFLHNLRREILAYIPRERDELSDEETRHFMMLAGSIESHIHEVDRIVAPAFADLQKAKAQLNHLFRRFEVMFENLAKSEYNIFLEHGETALYRASKLGGRLERDLKKLSRRREARQLYGEFAKYFDAIKRFKAGYKTLHIEEEEFMEIYKNIKKLVEAA